jgi:hypothetical protein
MAPQKQALEAAAPVADSKINNGVTAIATEVLPVQKLCASDPRASQQNSYAICGEVSDEECIRVQEVVGAARDRQAYWCGSEAQQRVFV